MMMIIICSRKTDKVESKKKNVSSNKKGNWNHLKMIKKMSAITYLESTESLNYRKQPYLVQRNTSGGITNRYNTFIMVRQHYVYHKL